MPDSVFCSNPKNHIKFRNIIQESCLFQENNIISERIKRNHYQQCYCNVYFWRTQSQQEIDFIEERNGVMSIFEMKWNPKKAKIIIPESFTKAYPVKETAIITPENYLEWLL